MADLAVPVICAVVWWIPAFVALSDLQRREGLPRPVVWRWMALISVPLVGPLVYFRRGRPALEAHRTRRRPRRSV